MKLFRVIYTRADRFKNESLANFYTIIFVGFLMTVAKIIFWDYSDNWQLSKLHFLLPLVKNFANSPSQVTSLQGWLFLLTCCCFDCLTLYFLSNHTVVLVELVCMIEAVVHCLLDCVTTYHKLFRLGYIAQIIIYCSISYPIKSIQSAIFFGFLKLLRIWSYQLLFWKCDRTIFIESKTTVTDLAHWAVMDNLHFIELLYLKEDSDDKVIESLAGCDLKVNITKTDPDKYKRSNFWEHCYIPFARYGMVGFSIYELQAGSLKHLFKDFLHNPYYSIKDHSCQELAIMSSTKSLSMLRQSDIKTLISTVIALVYSLVMLCIAIVLGLTSL